VSNQRLLVFSTVAYDLLRASICERGEFDTGAIERIEFPDGEHYRRLLTDVAGRHVVFVAGTISDSDTLELFDCASAAMKYGARSLTLVIPFFGYATMERAVRPGEVVTAKTRARLISSIPDAAEGGNRVVLLDLHVEGIPHYFEGATRPVHLYGKPLIKEAVRELADGPFVLACTDAGRAKWVESLANDLGVSAAFVFKRRVSGDTTQVTAVSAQVEHQHVIIYDDMIRTGGSLMEAARAYKTAGAKRISAITTHGVFPGEALDKIQQSGLFDRVIATDSHPRALKLASARQDDFLRIISVAGLFAGYLRDHTP
jgi:ribose-phosphate pyrophosphokinase